MSDARDAIEDSGQVSIETSNVSLPDGMDVPGGDYVRLTVRDTGAGIAEDIQAHIFEHAQHPELPCIFMSDYATDVLSQTRADLAEVVLLRKPFTLDALAQGLQHVERKPARAAAST